MTKTAKMDYNLQMNAASGPQSPEHTLPGVASSRLLRLAALAGRLCPHCGCLVVLDGLGLICSDALCLGAKCFHTWHDPDAAEADLAARPQNALEDTPVLEAPLTLEAPSLSEAPSKLEDADSEEAHRVPPLRGWSPAQNRLFLRESRRRVSEAGQGMTLPLGYTDPFVGDSAPATREHIGEVQKRMNRVLADLARRSLLHDRSKLESPEKAGFDRAAHRLASCAYGTDSYRRGLDELKPTLDHHYAVNSHHPEHYPEGIRGMSLPDLLEMLVDWGAACQRSPDGDLRRSVEINQARFGYTDELKQILLNTVPISQPDFSIC